MIRVIMGALGLFVMYISVANGEWGTFWVTLIITLLLILGWTYAQEGLTAYSNRQHYWATGETNWPDRNKRRGGREESLDDIVYRIRKESWREMDKHKKRERKKERNRAILKVEDSKPEENYRNEMIGVSPLNRDEMLFICSTCGRKVSAKPEMTEIQNEKVLQFYCPYCKENRPSLIL